MLGEIREVPDTARRILAHGRAETQAVADAIRSFSPRWVTLAARGTSDHAATYAQYLVETHLGLPVALAKPSVTTVYGRELTWAGGLVIGISQSGQSPDIVAVVRSAREAGALTVAITNDEASPLAEVAAHVLPCHAGPELAVPATKTYVAQLVVVAGLVAAIAEDDRLARGLTELPESLDLALDRALRWVETDGAITVEALAVASRALLVSRGYNLATVLELGLKLKETVGLFAEAYSIADFAHGPRALAGPDVPVIAIRPDGPMGERVDATLASIAGDAPEAVVIGGGEVEGRRRALSLPLPLPEALTPPAFILPGQVLVEATARRLGVSPDAPEGLRKVTRTR